MEVNMEENRIIIDSAPKETTLLAMGGTDSRGNLWQVDNRSFLKNGKRFLPVMGEFHFSRYEPEDWEEELLKMRAGGVDIAATYVFWIHHEERQGEWDFTGCRDLRRFLEICRRIDMPVWLRIGPWAHGECRNGGFPDWVVSDPERKARTNDPAYLELVKAFYNKVGEQAAGMTAKDGGPVLGIQLENEYGHCGGPSDREEGMAHMRTLKKLALEAGFDVPYYTATGWGGAYVVDGETLPVLGGYVDALRGGVRVGGRGLFITEACEYVESFLTLSPTIALISNIDNDHLDYFHDMAHIEAAFEKFLARLPQDGVFVACTDDARVRALYEASARRAVSYGLAGGDYTAADIAYDGQGCPAFTAVRHGAARWRWPACWTSRLRRRRGRSRTFRTRAAASSITASAAASASITTTATTPARSAPRSRQPAACRTGGCTACSSATAIRARARCSPAR